MKTILKLAFATLAICAVLYGICIMFAHDADQITFGYTIKQILASGVVAFVSTFAYRYFDDED